MTTALLLVDLQVGLLAGDNPVHDAEGLADRLRRLAERARDRGVPVVHVQDDDLGDPTSQEWQIDPRLGPADADVRVRKTACDAFHETGLDELLRGRGVQHLVLAGCTTELCIDTTARRATTLGYDVTLVEDGHSTHDGEMPATAVIAHHHRILDGFGAYVRRRPCEIRLRPADGVDFEPFPEPTELQPERDTDTVGGALR